MTRPTTCGQGLAAHAPLPTTHADLAAATADVLRSHLEMLDRTDLASEREHGAYLHLIEGHRAAAETLRALGTDTESADEVESCWATSSEPSCECPPVTNHEVQPEPCWFTSAQE
jgi:hypothetical protein